jgi:hypothetical protein
MNIKKHKTFILFIILIIISTANTFAQCAMCKTSVESDLKNGGSIGTNLNYGILYLMAIPYVVLMCGGYFFFRKQINAKIKAWRKKAV